MLDKCIEQHITIKEGRINPVGYLSIKRCENWKEQLCPHNTQKCGDWCPLFRDPVDTGIKRGKNELLKLEICGTLLYFDTFEDQRITVNF